MRESIEWLWGQREWVFSGLGIFLVSGLLSWFNKKKQSESKKQTIVGNSNITVGGDMTVGGSVNIHAPQKKS